MLNCLCKVTDLLSLNYLNDFDQRHFDFAAPGQLQLPWAAPLQTWTSCWWSDYRYICAHCPPQAEGRRERRGGRWRHSPAPPGIANSDWFMLHFLQARVKTKKHFSVWCFFFIKRQNKQSWMRKWKCNLENWLFVLFMSQNMQLHSENEKWFLLMHFNFQIWHFKLDFVTFLLESVLKIKC